MFVQSETLTGCLITCVCGALWELSALLDWGPEPVRKYFFIGSYTRTHTSSQWNTFILSQRSRPRFRSFARSRFVFQTPSLAATLTFDPARRHQDQPAVPINVTPFDIYLKRGNVGCHIYRPTFISPCCH